MLAGLFDRLAGRAINLMTREGVVRAVEDLNDRFRRFTVEVEDDTPRWAPGNKVQFVFGTRIMRTLTPFAWDGGRASFLVFRADNGGPLTPWADALAPGAPVRLLGPRRSVVFDVVAPPLLVGDETSVALAAAWNEFGSDPAAASIYEASAPEQLADALRALELGDANIVAREPGDAHLGALAEAVVVASRAHPRSRLVLTGRAQTIRAVRRELKTHEITSETRGRAYWDTNRTGLD